MADLTIERSDTEAIVIRRVERPGSKLFGMTVDYQGRMLNGRIDGTMRVHWPGVLPHDLTGPWFAVAPRTTCDEGMLPLDARDAGVMALRFQHADQAVACFIVGARQGNGECKLLAGAVYAALGHYEEALRWLKESAIQGDAMGQLALAQWYELGLGMARPDMEQAAKWRRTLHENPVYIKNQQQMQQLQWNQQVFMKGVEGVVGLIELANKFN